MMADGEMGKRNISGMLIVISALRGNESFSHRGKETDTRSWKDDSNGVKSSEQDKAAGHTMCSPSGFKIQKQRRETSGS